MPVLMGVHGFQYGQGRCGARGLRQVLRKIQLWNIDEATRGMPAC